MCCYDISVPKSVHRTTALRKIFKQKKFFLQYSAACFRITNNVNQPLGTAVLGLRAPVGFLPIRVKYDVVNIDVALPLELDILDKQCSPADTVKNQLTEKIIIF